MIDMREGKCKCGKDGRLIVLSFGGFTYVGCRDCIDKVQLGCEAFLTCEKKPKPIPIPDPEPELKTGTITGITGNPMSGLWTIHFMSGASAHIESGYGIRALVACFGSLDDARGKTITYTTDMFGVMVGFSPVED